MGVTSAKHRCPYRQHGAQEQLRQQQQEWQAPAASHDAGQAGFLLSPLACLHKNPHAYLLRAALCLQKTEPSTHWDDSQPPVTPAPGDLIPLAPASTCRCAPRRGRNRLPGVRCARRAPAPVIQVEPWARASQVLLWVRSPRLSPGPRPASICRTPASPDTGAGSRRARGGRA